MSQRVGDPDGGESSPGSGPRGPIGGMMPSSRTEAAIGIEARSPIRKVEQVAPLGFKSESSRSPYWVSTPPWLVAVPVVVVVVVDVAVEVTVEVSGVVVVVVVDVVGVVVLEVVELEVVVVDEVVAGVVVVLEDVVVEFPLSLAATTASAMPRPMTTATRITIRPFIPPLIP
jgi:hypothetical protein